MPRGWYDLALAVGRDVDHVARGLDTRHAWAFLWSLAIANLGRNLAVAGAVQRAFALGQRSESDVGWEPNVYGEAAP